MQIRTDDPKAPHVAALLTHHIEELRSVMGEHAFALDSADLSSPEVTFWTAWRGDELSGFAALRSLGQGAGEVKSMRAAPWARRAGAGRALLDHIVGQARARGYRALYLETGTADLHGPAVALYRKAGFLPCGPFADYEPSPQNQFMMLTL